MIVTATVDIAHFPPQSLVTLGEDLEWWAEDPTLAKYMQTLSPDVGITPWQPSRVKDVYEHVKMYVPSLNTVAVEDEANAPPKGRKIVY